MLTVISHPAVVHLKKKKKGNSGNSTFRSALCWSTSAAAERLPPQFYRPEFTVKSRLDSKMCILMLHYNKSILQNIFLLRITQKELKAAVNIQITSLILNILGIYKIKGLDTFRQHICIFKVRRYEEE